MLDKDTMVKQLNRNSFKLYELNLAHKMYEDNYKAEKDDLTKKILKSLGKKTEVKCLDVAEDGEETRLKVLRIEPERITFNAKEFAKYFEKELCNEIIEKEYEIGDMKDLVKYLKSCHVNPKKFKKYLNVKESVNVKKIDQMIELGDLDEAQINNLKYCYTSVKSKPYLKLSLTEDDE